VFKRGHLLCEIAHLSERTKDAFSDKWVLGGGKHPKDRFLDFRGQPEKVHEQ
jgi:hypothetical protein